MTDLVQAEINAITCIIANTFSVESIYLFGSYAYGNPGKYSDIDLYVILKHDAPTQGLAAVMQIRKAIAHARSLPVDILVRKKQDFLTKKAEGDATIEGRISQRWICIHGVEIVA